MGLAEQDFSISAYAAGGSQGAAPTGSVDVLLADGRVDRGSSATERGRQHHLHVAIHKFLSDSSHHDISGEEVLVHMQCQCVQPLFNVESPHSSIAGGGWA